MNVDCRDCGHLHDEGDSVNGYCPKCTDAFAKLEKHLKDTHKEKPKPKLSPCPSQALYTLQKFRQKYGTQGWRLMFEHDMASTYSQQIANELEEVMKLALSEWVTENPNERWTPDDPQGEA